MTFRLPITETSAHRALQQTLGLNFILITLLQGFLLFRHGQALWLLPALGVGLVLGLPMAVLLTRFLNRCKAPAKPVIPFTLGTTLTVVVVNLASLHLTVYALLEMPLFFRQAGSHT